MNIAIFTPSQNPYSETFIQVHKKYLKGRVFYYYGNKGHIQLEGSGRLVSKAKQWQYRLICKLKKYSNTYINEQAVLASLKAHAIDVILVEYGTHAYQLLSILKQCDFPVVVHFHGFDASVYGVVEGCKKYEEVFALTSKVIVVSRKMEQMLLEVGCPKDKLVYNVYGPQPEFETINPTFAKKQFIGVGRFTDKKAPYYTLMAFKEVVHKHPDARLLLAGDGDLLNVCKNLVLYYGLEKQVEFLGVITPEEYRKLLSESLAFVQHSITAVNGDMEGTPLAILEASAAGLPVISTYHAGIPDVIEHNKTGLLCMEHDVDTMSLNMIKILDDINYAKKMGQAGKERIQEEFSMQQHIKSLQETLHESSLKGT